MRPLPGPGLLLAAALLALVVGGCARGGGPGGDPRAGVLPGGGLEEQRAREIMAVATGVPADDVTLLAKSAVAGVALVTGSVPADPKLLAAREASGQAPEGEGDAARLESVTVRWDLPTGRPVDITWSDRLQFAAEEPITQEQAQATAEELKRKWWPEVPARMVMAPPHRLHRPVWVIAWQGQTEDGTRTGDEVVVQVSAVTGLPIAYTQRMATQRPTRELITITRDQAIATVRAALEAAGAQGAQSAPLEAELILSAPEHPQGGPAWIVRSPEVTGRARAVVDAMSGELIRSEDTEG